MIQNILVCLEGSKSSEAAANVAVEIAGHLKARLVGMAIVDEPDIRAGQASGIGGSSFKHERDESLVADAHQHATDWLAQFHALCKGAGIDASTIEVVGRPEKSILAQMEAGHDLTVIGRDANFRFETQDEDTGTVPTVLRKTTRPVLLVPEREPGADPDAGANFVAGLGGTVLVGYDGSGAARRAAASFAASGLAEGRTIHVATVDDSGGRAWEMAHRAVEMFRDSGFDATAHNVVSLLSNGEALAELRDKLGAGLMVMGAFTRSRLAELFTSSVTRLLIEQTPIPIYLQH